MKRLITLLFCLLPGLQSFAQRETDNWYFGDLASLEFNKAGVPTSFANSAMSTQEGCASISDEFGNLLFYTNGETVWNALHLPMANGTGLFGDPNSTQSSVIVKKPGSNSIFYLFTAKHGTGANAGVWYSEIDMTAYNGLGEVKNTAKNILAFTFSPLGGLYSGKLTATYASNHRDLWVILQFYAQVNYQQFISFKITSAGFAGGISSPPLNSASRGQTGYLKASPDGKNLVACLGTEGINLFNFNNKTGIVTNPVMLEPIGQHVYYGVEFSPDGSKLYTANQTNGEVRQFNLTNPSPSAILASRTLIGTSTGTNSNGALQLASNGKIYLARQGSNSLMEIANPNTAGMACNFRQGPTLAPLTFSNYGLPNFMQGFFEAPRFTFTGDCQSNPFVFTITNQTGIDSVRWDFGDPLSGVTNTSGSKQPTHIFRIAGFFKVTLTVYIGGEASFFSRQVDVKNSPLVAIGRDTVLCYGNTLTLKNAYPRSAYNETYLWSTGEKNSLFIKVNSAGTYWLELSNGTCTTRDSIKVSYVNGPSVTLGSDTIVCGTRAVTIKPKVIDPSATYLWQPGGQTTPSIQVTKTGLYQVMVMKNGCQATDLRNVKFIPGLDVNLGPDQELCEGEEVILKAPAITPPPVYLWSDTSAGKTLKVKKSGKYWLRVTRNGCSVTDTVNIKFKPCPPPIMPIVPNIITPNADGRNDKLVIGNLPEGVFWSLKLYNRWGQLILDEPVYQHNWPQKNLLDGHYYYLLTEPETGRTWKGWLEVIH